MVLSDIVVVLCRPTEPGNVGAACRAMKNMGLSRLRIVAPSPMDEASLVARAVHADDLWRNAAFFDSLPEATADCSLVIGTTRRRGSKRKSSSMEPRALATWLANRGDPGDSPKETCVALVFGNERTGLDDDELSFCNIASHIPADKGFPSLNLSHAVQVYAYELFLAFSNRNRAVKGEWIPLAMPAVDRLTAEINKTFADLGFYKQSGHENRRHFLRDLICRAALTEKEGRYLKTIFAKVAGISGKEDE
jgi:tRNA/rRNA methyltransferase/tRNA (cytidine32/uridine32-2'-O)-methyltransferase